MNENIAAFAMLTLLGCAGVALVVSSSRRSAGDVLNDLEDGSEDSHSLSGLLRSERLNLSDDLGQAGLFSNKERRAFFLRGRLYPIAVAAVLVLLKQLAFPGKPQFLVAAAAAGFAVGYLMSKARLRRAKERYIRSLEFYLPVVMERLVMAVQSGLDILAALGAIVKLECEEADAAKNAALDPVTRLLAVVHRLAEGGLTFELALREVADHVECSAVRHSFIHLAVAHTEGGELVMPLKELSDSTQLYYQESIDEQIAKLPVQATMPLLCTFTGLILCFITSPVVQLMHLVGSTAKNLK